MSVVVPFRGGRDEAQGMLAALARLRLGSGDELIVADNTRAGVVPEGGPARVVRAPRRRSAFHARNAGAAVATGEWLLFTDGDCEPPADLLERLWEPEPAPGCGAVAGEARGDASQTALLARWARSRRGAIASHHRELGSRPAGTTANLLVRRAAFEAVGGFCEVRSEADTELCWRLTERGQRLEYRPAAVVAHRDPERLGDVVRQAAGYGAGRRWLRSSFGDAVPGMPLARPLGRAVGGALAWTLALRFQRAAFKLVDGVVAAAGWWGYTFGDNRPG